MTSNPRVNALHEAGVSVWLDDLSRTLIESGELARVVRDLGVVGVTSNPTIFAAALANDAKAAVDADDKAGASAYTAALADLAARGADVEEAVFELTTTDVRDACDVLRPVYDATGGRDGRVSLEVDPRLARDTEATIASARRLWASVDRPNVMIKIPATVEGLPAISAATAAGISVNVTLIFSLDRYRGVMNAYLKGLEQARENGIDLATLHSVASFFVSRVDSEVDRRLHEIGTPAAHDLRGQAAIANARLAYQAFEEVFGTPRWAGLADDGAHAQRPLWASTGVKNPDYPDTLYVTELVAPDTVNTMPRATLDAVADHGEIAGDRVRGRYDESVAVLDALEALGIAYTDVTDQLEREGLTKFETSWAELLATVSGALERAAGPQHSGTERA